MIDYSIDQNDIFFDKLKKFDFACSVGKSIDNKDVIQIENWERAIRNLRSQKWEDFWVDRHNDFHDQIRELKNEQLQQEEQEEIDQEKIEEEIQAILKSLNESFAADDDDEDEEDDDYEDDDEDEEDDDEETEWNLMIYALKSTLLPIVDEKIDSLTLSLDQKKAISSEIDSVFLKAYLENKFRDHVTDPFYTRLLEWYFKGHFPCGWEGNYPDGKLIVF